VTGSLFEPTTFDDTTRPNTGIDEATMKADAENHMLFADPLRRQIVQKAKLLPITILAR